MIGLTAFFAVFFVCLIQFPVYGYADPGSGSLVWQLLTAGLLGLTFYLRSIFQWIKSKFGSAGIDSDPSA